MKRTVLLLASAALALLLSCGLALIGVALPAHAAFPGQNGRIAFSDQWVIRTIAPDGSRPRQTTDDLPNGYDREPAWSPSGTKMAFMRCEHCSYNPTTEQGIWVKDVRTGVETQLSDGSDSYDDNFPAWSPDGDKIAFVRIPEDGSLGGELYTMNSDGTGVTQLTNSGRDASHPAWSPRGNKIAFQEQYAYENNIWVVNADGTGRRT